jgi:hypothetical protein
MTFPPFMAEISAVVEAKEKEVVANGMRGYGRTRWCLCASLCLVQHGICSGVHLGATSRWFLGGTEGLGNNGVDNGRALSDCSCTKVLLAGRGPVCKRLRMQMVGLDEMSSAMRAVQ